jgi:hypothetical protein
LPEDEVNLPVTIAIAHYLIKDWVKGWLRQQTKLVMAGLDPAIHVEILRGGSMHGRLGGRP